MLVRTGFTALILIAGFSCLSQQIKTTALLKNVPTEIHYRGKFKKAISWSEISGERHIVLLSESGIYNNSDPESSNNRNADLFAVHYTSDKVSLKQWEIHDFVDDCPIDVIADFLGKDIPITDLDKNGQPEIWIIYKIACRGDVSPDNMKLIMYQGKKKYAMRGENKVIYPGTEPYGGSYTFDSAFLSGPTLFREFARKIWNENLIQKM